MVVSSSRIGRTFAGLILLCAGAWGQVTGSISGHVQDVSGSAVSGAMVAIKSVETGATRNVETDADGNFRAVSLPVGPQEVRASKNGFKVAIRKGVDLVVAQEAVVDLKLEVGDLAQEVTVTAEAPLVNTTTSSVSGLVGETQVKELPLNGRSFDNLIALNTGAINYALKSPQTSTSNGNTFSVGGRRPMDNLFLMNGVEYTGASQLSVTPGGVSGYLLGIDAVREFNVLTETYSAEYGKRSGAQVTVVTQSGSNQLHGSVFEFLRNSALDARNFFDQGPVPPFRRNQFGGALGGPIKKDKIFLFGNYEGFRQSLAVSNVSVVPDDQARQGSLPNSSGVYVPVTNLDSRMLGFMDFWPRANGPQLLANGLPSGTALSFNNPKQAIHEDFGTAKGDYVVNEKDTLAISYTIDAGNSTIPLAGPLFANVNDLRAQVATLRETHVISPRTVNTFTAGFSRAAYNLGSSSLVSYPSSLSFVSGAAPGGIVIGGGLTTSGIASITGVGTSNAVGASNRRNILTFSDTFQTIRGIHQITGGVWFQRLRDNEDTASRRLGQATFTSLTTFLQGTVSNFQVIPNPTGLGWRNWMGAWFLEDSIKLNRRLSLRLGVRHEFTDGWNEVAGRASNYVTDSNGVLLTNPVVGESAYTKNNATKLFAPRVGLAWDVFGDGRTAIRAGYGMHYSLVDNLAFLLNSLPPYNGAVSFANRSLFSIIPITPSVQPAPACTGGTGVPAGCTIFAPQGVQSDLKTPAVQQWNFTIEQRLTTNTALRVAYMGSFGYHGLLSVDPNTVPAQICASATCTAGGVGTTTSTVTQGMQYIPAVGAGNRPNKNLSGAFFWNSQGNTSYNALQLDVTRRLTKGFQMRANYTFSKSLDMNSGLTGAQSNNQAQMILDRSDVRRDWGPSALNATHQSSISGHYELPIGKGKRIAGNVTGITDKLVSGWQFNAIATMLSGFPFTPLVGSNRSGDGDTRNPDRPNVNPAFSGPVIVGTPQRWYDPNAFSLPQVGTYGNVGRSILTGPGLSNVDLSLFKNTSISERVSLQFRAEAFNLLNRTNFGLPNTTAFSGTAISSSAGLITTTVTTSRQIQFGMKLIF